jgi:hypothetical protein
VVATFSPGLRDPARDASSPLPPLTGAGSGVDPYAPPGRHWSPPVVGAGLFAVTWVCFGALAARTSPASGDSSLTDLGHLLAGSAAVLALVLATLTVAHRQVAGLWPRPVLLLGLAATGLAQARLAFLLAGSGSRLWAPAAHVFELVGFAVPLTWVAAEFHHGVRRQRDELTDSLLAAHVEVVRHQARQTVEAVQRHEVRSMLFAVDGAARPLADESLAMTAADRVAFGRMVLEGAERLGKLMDVAPDEVQPFAADGVAKAVVHAERKGGRTVRSSVPVGLRAVGRAADTAGVLRTLVSAVAAAGADVALRAEADGPVVAIRVEAADSPDLPLDTAAWRPVDVAATDPQAGADLYVAARLLAEQGGDLWEASGPRFAVRLPAAEDQS